MSSRRFFQGLCCHCPLHLLANSTLQSFQTGLSMKSKRISCLLLSEAKRIWIPRTAWLLCSPQLQTVSQYFMAFFTGKNNPSNQKENKFCKKHKKIRQPSFSCPAIEQKLTRLLRVKSNLELAQSGSFLPSY